MTSFFSGSSPEWSNRDKAFTDIARGIREVVKGLKSGAQSPLTPAQPAPVVTPTPVAQAPTVDRAALVQTVSGLSSGDFAQLVTLIAGASSHVSRHGLVSEKAAELFDWAESRTGPGLAAIREALGNFR